jgi:hypothetical protein
MSSQTIKKEMQIQGKGQNAIVEIINPMEHTPPVSVTVQGHVPEIGGTCFFPM